MVKNLSQWRIVIYINTTRALIILMINDKFAEGLYLDGTILKWFENVSFLVHLKHSAKFTDASPFHEKVLNLEIIIKIK